MPHVVTETRTLGGNCIIKPRPLPYKAHCFIYIVNVVEDIVHYFILSLVQKHKKNSSLVLVPGLTVLNCFSFTDTVIPLFKLAAQKLNMCPNSSKCVKV